MVYPPSTVLKVFSIVWIQLKKEKDEKEEKEKHFNKNLDNFGDHLKFMVQNVKNLQSKV
jgi:hypothetical protein